MTAVVDSSVLERARAALHAVERRVGVEHNDHRLAPVEPTPPQPVTALLPEERWPAGAAAVVTGSTSLLVSLLGAVQGDGWCAIVGWPELHAPAIAEAGGDLERVVLVPDVHGDGATVVAALLQGIDVTVVGPHVQLSGSERRRLLARARERGTTIVSPVPWEGAVVTVRAELVRWSGADRGSCWLRETELALVRHARADGAGRRFQMRRDRDAAAWVEPTWTTASALGATGTR